MQLSEALARTHITRLTEFTCLADVLEDLNYEGILQSVHKHFDSLQMSLIINSLFCLRLLTASVEKSFD
ncbi:hypothetical protein [Shewanella baltica]|uniref:hypothetical protein n=1 Tax=Shewanella baltica TaxID=62322 RepID=UPI0039AF8870